METKAFLYVMTTTRLYVLDDDRLVALEDCSPKCDLLVSGGMVLLVESKGIRVFTEDGRPLGVALTKAPIRRAYVDEGELVIETRTQRGRFRGVRAAPEERSVPVTVERQTITLMADHVTAERRSYIMSKVRQKDTKPELALRRALHRTSWRPS